MKSNDYKATGLISQEVISDHEKSVSASVFVSSHLCEFVSPRCSAVVFLCPSFLSFSCVLSRFCLVFLFFKTIVLESAIIFLLSRARPNNLSLVCLYLSLYISFLLFGHIFFICKKKRQPKHVQIIKRKYIYNDKYRHTRARLVLLLCHFL
jgi:hypothetical protein